MIAASSPWPKPQEASNPPLPDPSENLGSYVGPGLDRQEYKANRPCLQQLGGDVVGEEDCLKVRTYSPELPNITSGLKYDGSPRPILVYLDVRFRHWSDIRP